MTEQDYVLEELRLEVAERNQRYGQQARGSVACQNYYASIGFAQDVAQQIPEHIRLRAKVRQLRDELATERERCAKIADAAVAEYDMCMEPVYAHETWAWAMNEMADGVNATWNEETRKLRNLAAKIRSAE